MDKIAFVVESVYTNSLLFICSISDTINAGKCFIPNIFNASDLCPPSNIYGPSLSTTMINGEIFFDVFI